jgi:hypothetical protein
MSSFLQQRELLAQGFPPQFVLFDSFFMFLAEAAAAKRAMMATMNLRNFIFLELIKIIFSGIYNF